MKQGIIKINPITFEPLLCVENGRVLCGGTKREKIDYDCFKIHKNSVNIAFENLDKKVDYTLNIDKFGETIATILKPNGK